MTGSVATLALYALTALLEIAGCFAFWAWLRLDRSDWWAVAGTASLVLFAVLLTRADSAYAGRAFAAYGGVYIASSLVWLWTIESTPPDRWDIAGGAIALMGAALILWGPRS